MHSPASAHLVLILRSIPSTMGVEVACLSLCTAQQAKENEDCPYQTCEARWGGLLWTIEFWSLQNPLLSESFAFIPDLCFKCERRQNPLENWNSSQRLFMTNFDPRSEFECVLDAPAPPKASPKPLISTILDRGSWRVPSHGLWVTSMKAQPSLNLSRMLQGLLSIAPLLEDETQQAASPSPFSVLGFVVYLCHGHCLTLQLWLASLSSWFAPRATTSHKDSFWSLLSF